MPRIASSLDAHEVRVLVATADDHLAAWACDRLPGAGMTVCDQAEDMNGAVRLARALRPDLCLLDVALPGGAMTALERILARPPATRVVMLAGSPDDPALLSALAAGASGCMVGTPDGPALRRALSDVLAGHAALPRALVGQLVAGLGPA